MPSTALRQNVLAQARRVVVKLGSRVLTRNTGRLDLQYVRRIADQVAQLRQGGMQVTLVSSGAVAAGCAELRLKARPSYVADLQAVAAVGQRRLMTHFHQAFARHRIPIAQALLTRTDFDDRIRFLNIRNCITRLHKLGCLPILNENDTVAVDEIRFGDNDLLAALVSNALRADALVLLTGVDGLLDRQGNTIDMVSDFRVAQGYAREEKTVMGSGGIMTKLQAAQLVTNAGEIAVIANGRATNVLPRLFAAERLGTVFVPAGRKLTSRRRWIGLTTRPAGSIAIDTGAAEAISRRGKSLLASGIVAVSGKFKRGQVISIMDTTGREVARGLTNYPDHELRLIIGKRSNQFAKILGRAAYAAVIHRDNLAVARGD